MATLGRLFDERGEPAYIRSDNGAEFVAESIKHWLAASGLETLYIEPGAPWENAYSETFISRLPDELLNREVFANLTEAHGALGYFSPMEFAELEKLSGQRPAPRAELEELESVPRLS